ncbi:MAG TPA: hypothetical protein VMB66_06450 [Candidatus Acidoferrales bacterium]|nr:hypothetical protein [Candidatus Acidoferrales bacterium]
MPRAVPKVEDKFWPSSSRSTRIGSLEAALLAGTSAPSRGSRTTERAKIVEEFQDWQIHGGKFLAKGIGDILLSFQMVSRFAMNSEDGKTARKRKHCSKTNMIFLGEE